MIHLTASDIKQYLDCPRLVFFTYTQPVAKKATPKISYRNISLKSSRKLKKYHLDEGKQIFSPTLTSARLGLSGQPDLIVKGKEGVFAVELTSQKPPKNHIYQLAAYALLLEDHYGIMVNKGFVYLIPLQDIEVFNITRKLKDRSLSILSLIRQMIKEEQMPEPGGRQCADCEYQNFCGDIW